MVTRGKACREAIVAAQYMAILATVLRYQPKELPWADKEQAPAA
jgi:hypothetical protein